MPRLTTPGIDFVNTRVSRSAAVRAVELPYDVDVLGHVGSERALRKHRTSELLSAFVHECQGRRLAADGHLEAMRRLRKADGVSRREEPLDRSAPFATSRRVGLIPRPWVDAHFDERHRISPATPDTPPL